jgi:hypothetical protein
MFGQELSLAIMMQAAKGCMALLLGSGISRSAGIATGWEVVLNLIERLARLEQEAPAQDPEAWFRSKYGADPGYSTLLVRLAPSQAARQQLLRSFFEPTDEEREQGLKTPSAAHRGIAQLVQTGAVRVIITTNFDRLLELSLEEVGIRPTVLWNSDTLAGATPLSHSQCTIIKVHGDYLDTRIKNSPDELASYEPAIDRLLDRIFDDYGILVCGWSAAYDTALCAAVNRSTSSRYPVYWTTVDQPSAAAADIVSKRKAIVLHIKGAEHFFPTLAEQIQALDDLAKHQPLTTKAALATAKRLMSESRLDIRLHDFITDQVHLSLEQMRDEKIVDGDGPASKDEFLRRLRGFERAIRTPAALFAAAAYWDCNNRGFIVGFENYRSLALARGGGLAHHFDLKRLPLIYCFYAAGVVGLLTGHLNMFSKISELLIEQATHSGDYPPSTIFWADSPFHTLLGQLSGQNELDWLEVKRNPAASERVLMILRPILDEYLPDERLLVSAFDKFEYLFSLIHADFRLMYEKATGKEVLLWMPIGSYAYRGQLQVGPGMYVPGLRQVPSVVSMVNNEITEAGIRWSPLVAGLFGGSPDRVKAAVDFATAFFVQHKIPI